MTMSLPGRFTRHPDERWKLAADLIWASSNSLPLTNGQGPHCRQWNIVPTLAETFQFLVHINEMR